jgi:hypothetical protein
MAAMTDVHTILAYSGGIARSTARTASWQARTAGISPVRVNAPRNAWRRMRDETFSKNCAWQTP